MDSAFDDINWDMASSLQSTPLSMTLETQDSPISVVSERVNSTMTKPTVKFQVCGSCRRKKRKCSQERPSCSLCRDNGWTCEYRSIRKKPGPAKGTVGLRTPFLEIKQPPALSKTGIAIVMNADTERKLIDLYFAHIQPSFPMFCKISFMKEFAEKKIPNKLLNAFFAVSLAYLPPSEISSLFGSSCNDAREMFAQLAYQGDVNATTTLNDVKSNVLMTIYEYTNFPGTKAWMMAGKMVRSAIGMGLSRIDSVRNSSLTEFELEERRFVWWSVWKLDSAVNCFAASPFGIDDQSIGTAIISTSIAAFEAGLIEKSTQKFLPTDPVRSWKFAQELLAADTEDGTNMFLFAASYLRSVSLCRQRLHANPTPDLVSQLMAMRNTLSCVRLSLPVWYFDPARQSDLEGPEKHQHRLETIVILHMAQIQAFLPFANARVEDLVIDNDLGNWQECVALSEKIAATINHWGSEYFSNTDPMLSGLLWFAWFILTIHTMSIFSQSVAPDAKIANAVDLLIIALQRLARHWQLPRILLDSTKNLQIWDWLSMDFREVLSVLAQMRVPIDPQKQEPGSVDMWEVVAQRNEEMFGPPV